MKKDIFNMPKPVTIMGRSSSITNSFYNGIVPVIEPTDEEIKEALKILEQNEDDVRCVYCGDKKTEWDHLYPLIINKKHTGYITEIANLVPACGKCNQSKGNSNWKEWMLSNKKKSPKTRRIQDLNNRIRIIDNYDSYFKKQIINLEEVAGKALWEKYEKAYDSIIFNMESAQKIMDEIKQKISKPRKVFVVNTLKNTVQNSVNTYKVRNIKIDNVEQFWDGFETYLVKRGYKQFTPKGLPSTAPQYRFAVSDIKTNEKVTLLDFCNNIDAIITTYDIGGSKEHLGQTGHATWINALKRFREYLNWRNS